MIHCIKLKSNLPIGTNTSLAAFNAPNMSDQDHAEHVYRYVLALVSTRHVYSYVLVSPGHLGLIQLVSQLVTHIALIPSSSAHHQSSTQP